MESRTELLCAHQPVTSTDECPLLWGSRLGQPALGREGCLGAGTSAPATSSFTQPWPRSQSPGGVRRVGAVGVLTSAKPVLQVWPSTSLRPVFLLQIKHKLLAN